MTRCPRCQRRLSLVGECPIHGLPTAVHDAADQEPSLPEVLAPDGWTLGRVAAIGGTAVVYEVAGPTSAVLKRARRRNPESRSRFELEAEVLRSVGAPTTPALVDHGTIDDWPYIIMEHVGRDTLATWMAKHGARGGFGEVIAILTRITTALAALHDAGYVHRDLKPENISIGARGLRLIDFGLAKSVRRTQADTQVGTVVGTPHYMAPERLRVGAEVDHRADLYSLGVIAFEMFAGVPPFVGERRAIEYQHQVARPPSLMDARALPPQLDEIVMACLAKQPEGRPASAKELRDAFTRALTAMETIRGVGATLPAPPVMPAGQQSDVALAWIDGGDLVAITRAVTALQGIVVSQRGDGLLAAFSATHHDAPLAVALAACRNLARERCRAVLHVASALVRRSARGKPMAYGRELERVEEWIPATPFAGLVLTAGAAARETHAVPAADVPGFFREGLTATGHTTEVERDPAFVGRAALLERIAAAVAEDSVLVGISGDEGVGKTRLLGALATRLRDAGREVVDVRVRRRFLGDRADDDRVLQALGSADPAEAIAAAVKRRAVILVDDADRLSRSLLAALVRDGLPLARILTSSRPLFEVLDGATDRLAFELPPLSSTDAGALLRERLRPGRLIPNVLIERLALRGMGNPRLLLALARDLERRGAVRRNPGSDEWYVAADELDTLLASPGPSWLALRAVDDLPPEVAPVLRICAGLGPRFCADEVAHVAAVADPSAALGYLAREHVIVERNGWYELEDAALATAIYEHLLDERQIVHAAALEYWLAHAAANYLGWLARIAYHATAVDDSDTAVACWLALARAAQRRGELDQVERLLAQARASVADALPPVVRQALAAVEDDD